MIRLSACFRLKRAFVASRSGANKAWHRSEFMHDVKGQPMALTVDSNHQGVQRTFVTLRTFGDRWVVTSGLNLGNSVIVQRVQKVRPGMTVKPIPITLKTLKNHESKS